MTGAAPRSLTDLDGAILGLIARKPMSGYAIRKLFVTTPLGGYSDSPGSIYPALRRLEAQGLVLRAASRPGLGGRLHHATRRGRAAFRSWVAQQPTLREVESWPDGVLLRFAFADAVLSGRQIAAWLAELEKHLSVHLTVLEAFRGAHAGGYGRSGALALAAGIARYRSMLEWTRSARKDFTRGER